VHKAQRHGNVRLCFENWGLGGNRKTAPEVAATTRQRGCIAWPPERSEIGQSVGWGTSRLLIRSSPYASGLRADPGDPDRQRSQRRGDHRNSEGEAASQPAITMRIARVVSRRTFAVFTLGSTTRQTIALDFLWTLAKGERPSRAERDNRRDCLHRCCPARRPTGRPHSCPIRDMGHPRNPPAIAARTRPYRDSRLSPGGNRETKIEESRFAVVVAETMRDRFTHWDSVGLTGYRRETSRAGAKALAFGPKTTDNRPSGTIVPFS
jgi:hypothetical protein